MRMTVGKKLWTGFISVLLILIIVGASGLWALGQINSEYRSLLNLEVKSVVLFEQLLSNQNEDAKNIQGFIIYQDDFLVPYIFYYKLCFV